MSDDEDVTFRTGTNNQSDKENSVYLRPKAVYNKPQASGPMFKNANKQEQDYSKYTLRSVEENKMFKSFNSRKGCSFPNCRYAHICSIQGCGAQLVAFAHPKTDNENFKQPVKELEFETREEIPYPESEDETREEISDPIYSAEPLPHIKTSETIDTSQKEDRGKKDFEIPSIKGAESRNEEPEKTPKTIAVIQK
ncbi:Hypothetical predicted protein [Mytilus galloprovincialis]|uniref:Uncharacterized protein n=1 Tax=Mytilus galloprovincialis TaxID=29158 RepID=A0A8B6DUH5_MYTGA|nr:Hypothetical predicted protein [Mytilus galloprovincialis]